MEQSPHLNLFDPHSEVAEALIGFLSDSSYLHLDALFQKDRDSILAPPSSSSPKRYCCSELLIDEQLPRLLDPLPPLLDPLPPLLDPLPPLLDPLPPLLDPLPPLCYPPIVASGMGGCAENHQMSAQSVAARERRKRISERTQKLSQLIPSGTKMNTAEMLHAAFKYVKFLEAQVAILGVVRFVPEYNGANEYLQALLASTAVQERLSAEGFCIVPREMVDRSAQKPNIESGPLI